MSQPNRAIKLLDHLPSDLTLEELRELETRLKLMISSMANAQAQMRQKLYALELRQKYPGLGRLLESGRARLGEPKQASLYTHSKVQLPAGFSSRDLLDLDRADR